MTRREFLQVLAAAAAAGLPVATRAAQDLAPPAPRSTTARQAVRQRQPAALHRLPRAAAADLLPRAERQPRRRRRAGPAAAPRRRASAQALRHRARHARRARVHVSRLRARRAGVRHDGRLRAPRHAGAQAAGVAAGRAAARRRRHVAGLGDVAVDAGQDMVDAQKLLGVDVMTGHWEFTYGARPREGGRRERLRRQDRLRRAEREDRRLRRPGVQALRDPRRSTACRSRSSARRFRTRRSPIRATSFPSGRSASRKRRCRRSSTRRATKGAQVVVLLSHNGMDVDLKLASRVTGIDAILGGHTHDGVPQPTLVANRGGKTLVSNAGSNGKFLAVLDLDVKGGKVADFRYRLLPVFSDAAAAGSGHGRADRERARAVRREARREARDHRRPAVSPRQFQRHVRPADPGRADGREERGDRVLAGLPLGHVAAARARRSAWST